jgi:A/G-specific adenine glycosylase
MHTRAHCRSNYGCTVAAPEAMAPLAHGFTHFKLNIQPLLCQVKKFTPAAREAGQMWLGVEDALGAAIPAPVRTLLQRLLAPIRQRA